MTQLTKFNLQNIQTPPAAKYQKNHSIGKMGKRPKQTFLQRRYTDGQQAHAKMLNITNYQRNANQNYYEVPASHQSEWPSLISPQITNFGEGVEKREHSCTVGGNVNLYNHNGKQYGGTLENYTQNYQ